MLGPPGVRSWRRPRTWRGWRPEGQPQPRPSGVDPELRGLRLVAPQAGPKAGSSNAAEQSPAARHRPQVRHDDTTGLRSPRPAARDHSDRGPGTRNTSSSRCSAARRRSLRVCSSPIRIARLSTRRVAAFVAGGNSLVTATRSTLAPEVPCACALCRARARGRSCRSPRAADYRCCVRVGQQLRKRSGNSQQNPKSPRRGEVVALVAHVAPLRQRKRRRAPSRAPRTRAQSAQAS